MLLSLFVFLAIPAFALGLAGDNIVTLPDGTQLQGKKEGNVIAFKGVRFAQPPVGPLRWSAPQSWVNPNTSEVYDASKWGSKCLQKEGGGSEDCLFLNIFVSLDSISSGEDVPVGIFVHGKPEKLYSAGK
jgi:para-nitrobenzyl esterase